MHICLRSILILSTHLALGLPKSLFPAGASVEILKAFLPSSTLATWPAHLCLLDLITLNILGERYKLLNSSLWRFLHSPFKIMGKILGEASRTLVYIMDPWIGLIVKTESFYKLRGNYWTICGINCEVENAVVRSRFHDGHQRLCIMQFAMNNKSNGPASLPYHTSRRIFSK